MNTTAMTTTCPTWCGSHGLTSDDGRTIHEGRFEQGRMSASITQVLDDASTLLIDLEPSGFEMAPEDLPNAIAVLEMAHRAVTD